MTTTTGNDCEKLRGMALKTIESISNAIDEENKTASLKRIERVLEAIDTTILDYEIITGLDDLREAIEEYRAITRAGLAPEEYQEEKGSAFEAIQEVVGELDIDEDALKELEAPPVKTRWEQIIEFDRDHTLAELKRMAEEKGISPSGTKHAIIARLI